MEKFYNEDTDVDLMESTTGSRMTSPHKSIMRTSNQELSYLNTYFRSIVYSFLDLQTLLSLRSLSKQDLNILTNQY